MTNFILLKTSKIKTKIKQTQQIKHTSLFIMLHKRMSIFCILFFSTWGEVWMASEVLCALSCTISAGYGGKFLITFMMKNVYFNHIFDDSSIYRLKLTSMSKKRNIC